MESPGNYNERRGIMQHVMLTSAPYSCSSAVQYPTERRRERTDGGEEEEKEDDTLVHFGFLCANFNAER